MSDIFSLGYSVDTAQVLKGEAALDELTESTLKADGASKKLKTSSAEMGASINKAGQQASNLNRAVGGNGLRNMGLQLNQVAQQGAVTGNYMQALSVQLPDLLLGFGTLGIFAGIAAGALGPLALSLLSASDGAKATEDAFDNLGDAVQRYRAATDLATMSVKDLREEFGLQAEELRDTLNLLQDIELYKAMDQLNFAIGAIDVDRLRQLVAVFDDGAGEMSIVSETYNKAVAAIRDEFELTGEQASALMEKLNALNTAQGPGQISAATRDLNQYLLEAFGSVQKMPPVFREISQRLAEADVKAAYITKGMQDSATAARTAAGETVNWAAAMTDVRAELNAIAAIIASLGGGAISAAAKRTEIAALQAGNNIRDAAMAAAQFKENLEIDATVAGLESRFGRVGTILGGFVRSQAEYNRELDKTLFAEREAAIEREKAATKRGGAGGGGMSDSQYENNLAALLQSFSTEREALEVWYAESELLLNDHRARKLLGEEEHKAAMFALDAEYAERSRALADQTAQHEINAKQGAINAISGMFGVLAGESRAAALALIAISKGQAIAQAIQNTAVAKVRALAELGPIAGPPAAARIAAFGKIQIAAIAATGLAQAFGSGGGGSSGGSSGGVSATTPEPTPQPTQQVIIDMPNAPSWMVAMAEELFGQFQSQLNEGRVLVRST